jgi:glycosyltransferase involved in cell wall biosynthesis
MKVSVVVPVWNPGTSIQLCIESMRAQTLDHQEFEVIFVDDGSTDGTGQLLDELSLKEPIFKVIHIANSGWPGKPRNIGIAQALGEYIQFMDQDDHLAPEALERLYDAGRSSDADIVIGKVISNFRGVPHNLFRESASGCTLANSPLIESLTPHKMFSRRLLEENEQLRYPEGKRRLEDQLFMVKAYYAARSTAVVGDYACYFYWKREDGTNAGSTRIVPHEYYANLREVLDVVDANSGSAEERNRIYERFLRVELLGRLGGGAFCNYPESFRTDLVAAVRSLIHERFPVEIESLLAPGLRLRSMLARRGDIPALLRLADYFNGLTLQNTLDSVIWDDASLVVRAHTRLVLSDGASLPVQVVRDDAGKISRIVFDTSVIDIDRSFDSVDLRTHLDGVRVDLVAKMRGTSIEFFVPTTNEQRFVELAEGGPHNLGFEVTAEGAFDPSAFNSAGPLPQGVWDLYLRSNALGLTRTRRLGEIKSEGAALPGPRFGSSDVPSVVPYFTAGKGELSLAVDDRNKTVDMAVRQELDSTAAVIAGGALSLRIRVRASAASRMGSSSVVFHFAELEGKRKRVYVASERPRDGDWCVWEYVVSAHRSSPGIALPRGVWSVRGEVGSTTKRFSVPMTVVLDTRRRSTRVLREGELVPAPPLVGRTRNHLKRRLRSLRRRLSRSRTPVTQRP